METSQLQQQVEVLRDHFRRLTEIGLALSAEKDINKLLEMILNQARAISGADAGTLYIVDNKERSLHFTVLQNDSMNIRISRGEVDENILPPVPLYKDGEPNHSNVSSHVALTGEIVNIADVYEAENYDFTGPKKYDAATGYRTTSMVVIPMKDHQNNIIGVLQLINARHFRTGEVRSFSGEYIDMIAALASVAAVSLTKDRLIENLSSELEKTKKLQESEKELHRQIRDAYLNLEETNKRLSTALKKVRVIRWLTLVFILVLAVCGGGFYAWNKFFFQKNFPIDLSNRNNMPEPSTVQMYTVTGQHISSSISLAGKLEPLQQVSVVSPFTGKVGEKFFEYGQQVNKGRLLVRMDTMELGVSIREARSIFIKARQKLEELKTWSKSPEVSRAKRTMSKAWNSLEAGKRKLEETGDLFEKGIIPRYEYESFQGEFEDLKRGLESAEEELASVMEKGSMENVNIARWEVENARVKLRDLEGQLKLADVYAPVSGIIILPLSSGNENPKIIQKGVSMTQGEILLLVGNLEGLSVKSELDEVDISKIREGQAVKVSGDAFPDLTLEGKVSHVSSQAKEGDRPGIPMFNVIVTVESLTVEQKQRLRLGMSCNQQVMVYDNPGALLVPLSCVRSDGMEHWVMSKDRQTGRLKRVPVKTGMTTMDSVEILSGLNEGDEVAM